MNKKQFQADLINWFRQNQRQLPWRQNQDPYRVLVSEIMLQQTRVDTVVPYFNRFMEWFPTLEAFANASEEAILKSWEGLGYYSRVRNLHSAIQTVLTQYDGVIPNEREMILQLKGIGPYTAGAVLSIAYDQPEPAVDGNVMRVISRICNIHSDIAQSASKKQFEEKVRELISHENPSAFNQGLMELGALICSPSNPNCLICPVHEHCQAYAEGLQSQLPVKSKKVKRKKQSIFTVIVQNENGEILIRKRPDSGLLAGLWEFPSFEVNSVEQLQQQLKTMHQLQLIETLKPIVTFKHIFTHLTWQIQAYTAKGRSTQVNGNIWVKETELPQYAFPTPQQKIYEAFVLHESSQHREI